MTRRNNLSRRDILAATMLWPVVSNAKSGDISTTKDSKSKSDVLVVYFSRSGNTRVIAGQIQRALNTTIFEIQPAKSYPDDYEKTVAQAQIERDTNFKPPLKSTVPDFENYTTVFLGFPIWGQTAPPVIRAFLTAHNLTGKTLIPFITHGGYGLGNSVSVIKSHAPQAKLLEGFSLQADQEKQTLNRVTNWLGQINSKRKAT